jgi:ABC-type multidrug transport system ATPase subunit
MRISLSDIGKRYNRDWILRHCTYTFEPGSSYAITGPNGSGKSTLLQILAGILMPSQGVIAWGSLSPDRVFEVIALSAPYMEVIEEMTLAEFLSFHGGFKPWQPGVDASFIIRQLGLEASGGKQIRYFSSGMKQRVKLAQAIFSDTPVLLLDEPCTNFDEEGYALYRRLIGAHGSGRTIIVSSNDPKEYDFCTQVLRVADFNSK